MSKDITLLEEISEQDLHQVNGGTNLTGPGNYLASLAMIKVLFALLVKSAWTDVNSF